MSGLKLQSSCLCNQGISVGDRDEKLGKKSIGRLEKLTFDQRSPSPEMPRLIRPRRFASLKPNHRNSGIFRPAPSPFATAALLGAKAVTREGDRKFGSVPNASDCAVLQRGDHLRDEDLGYKREDDSQIATLAISRHIDTRYD